MEYRKVQISMPVEVQKRMDRYAEEKCMNRSEFIRHMVTVYETEKQCNETSRPGIEFLEKMSEEDRAQLRTQL